MLPAIVAKRTVSALCSGRHLDAGRAACWEQSVEGGGHQDDRLFRSGHKQDRSERRLINKGELAGA